MHSFNRKANINQIASGLRLVKGHELIVCDDGSIDGSREAWMRRLVRPNDFLILSNDLHEIRIMDRAIRFAAADFVCIVQDDDAIPRDTRWLASALKQLEKHPNLAIIGGFMAFPAYYRSPTQARDNAIWGEAPFQFVAHVNIGPYFIRKKCYEELGGWDFSLSNAGEPGIGFDSELCLRAWVRGYQVGYKFAPFKGPAKQYSLDGGTMLFSKEIRFRNQWRNHSRIHEMYSEHARRIAARVRSANNRAGIVT